MFAYVMFFLGFCIFSVIAREIDIDYKKHYNIIFVFSCIGIVYSFILWLFK